jgi:hypothetical protein
MGEDLPTLATTREAADYLRVSEGHIEKWAAEGRLPIAGRTESGLALFYKWVVERNGVALAAGEPVRIVPRPGRRAKAALLRKPRARSCGCCYPSTTRRDADGIDPGTPVFVCREAQGLDVARRLTAALAAAAPSDPFFARLAEVARDAFEQHLRSPAETIEGGAETVAKTTPPQADDDERRTPAVFVSAPRTMAAPEEAPL